MSRRSSLANSSTRSASSARTKSRVAPAVLGQVRNAGVEYTRTQICMKSGKVVGQSIQHVLKAAAATINTGVVSTVTTQDAAAAALVKKYKDQLSAKLDVKRASRKFNLFASVEGIFTESNLLVIVLLLSSAAKIPLPFSTIARAIDSMLFIN